MSRLGKKPIAISEKATVVVSGNLVTVKGPLGELKREFPGIVAIKLVDKTVVIELLSPSKEGRALWGTVSSHIMNMIQGVTEGFSKKLIIEGIGYKIEIKGEELVMNLGFSHQIKMKIPKNLKVVSEKGAITFSSFDKELLGQFAASVRALKEPEPYKGKGIRYDGEVIRRKQGKKTA